MFHYGGNARAPFGRKTLEETKRRRLRLSPSCVRPNIGADPSHVLVAVVETFRKPCLVVIHFTDSIPLGAIVGEKQNHRVIVLSVLAEVVEQAADALVEMLHHRGIDLHSACLDLLFLLRQRLPGSHPPKPLGRRCAGRNDALLHEVLDSSFSQHVVALVVDASVPVEVVVRGLEGPVRRRIGCIDEKGLGVRLTLTKVLEDLIGVEARRVEVLRNRDLATTFDVAR